LVRGARTGWMMPVNSSAKMRRRRLLLLQAT